MSEIFTAPIGQSARLACVALMAIVLCACSPQPPAEVAPPPLSDADIAANNRGVALMGYFDYAAARDQFVDVVGSRPEWLDARVNLAIATLNRQETDDEKTALELLDGVLAEDPGHLRAQYVAGVLRHYLGETELALSHFQKVVAADSADAYAAYYVGLLLVQLGQPNEAMQHFRHAIMLDPYLRSAYYQASFALQQTGDAEGAAEMRAAFQRLDGNPRARLAKTEYTKMGPLAEAVAAGRPGASPSPLPVGPVLLPGEVITPTNFGGERQGMTVTDVQGDGLVDLFITGALKPMGLGNALIFGRDDGELVLQSKNPLTRVADVTAVAWGDFDNDGLLDSYLCRNGANQLWRQTAADEWSNVTAATLTANGEFDCADTAMFDADHDGDLDIFVVNANGPNELLSNNLDGTFRTLAADSGLQGSGGGRQLLTADIDGDRDVDIVVINTGEPHEVWLNDRLWQYRAATGVEAFAAADIVAAVAGDVDADGNTEIYTMDTAQVVIRWLPGAGWSSTRVIDPPTSDINVVLTGVPQLALADFNGNGRPDLLVVNDRELAIHAFDDDGTTAQMFSEAGAYSYVVPWLWEVEEGPGLIGLKLGTGPSNPGANVARLPSVSAALLKWLPGSGRHRFVGLNFTGKEDQSDSMRSNRSGIGTHAALRVGSQWSLASNFNAHSGPGQSLMPLVFGLGGAAQADYVAINWSDGVFQTELNVEPGLQTIAETQRQLSSCPVLFAWNGERFEFVSDVLGVGGLGFMVSPGEVATPRPWEYFRLTEGAAVPRDGLLTFKLTEPMEEIAYVDSLSLHTIELPEGWNVVLDERMGTNKPAPTGEPIFYRESLLPSRAVNDRGDDVTGTILQVDAVAAPEGQLDHRFIGRLARPHVLTLEFPQALDSAGAKPVLVADGWVEYPYSQTVFAAWQANAPYSAPTLEARGADGNWQPVAENFGYPAGMPREMALPLVRLPAGVDALRLTTTLEVYWDRLRVVFAEPAPQDVRRSKVSVASAKLAKNGFPLRTDGLQRRPGYDYSQRSPYWDTRYPSGYYTAAGDVTALVGTTDDALAIFGPGEEIEFSFPVTPAGAGMSQVFVLEFRGWAKDMDLYTRDGGTVGPLPLRSQTEAPGLDVRDALHERFNTRYESGH